MVSPNKQLVATASAIMVRSGQQVSLTQIVVENFKSYKTKHVFGPITSFTAVIGPNGSGKSNFMDALCFVMGERSQNLRVSKLGDLVHGALTGQPNGNSASVTAVFHVPDEGCHRTFRRGIRNGSVSQYFVDDQEVSQQVYLDQLKCLGISAKAKNFFIFQGTVESIAIKNPKERTALFEEVSGSGALKEDYNQLKVVYQQAEERMQFVMQKKKVVAVERKGATVERDEAANYQQLVNRLYEARKMLALFELRQCEENLNFARADVHKEERRQVGREQTKIEVERILKEKKKESENIARTVSGFAKKIRDLEVQIGQKLSDVTRTRDRTIHAQGKLTNARHLLGQAQTARTEQIELIGELNNQLSAINAQLAELNSRREGDKAQPSEELISDYRRLKEMAGRASAVHLKSLDALQRQKEDTRNRLADKLRLREEKESSLAQLERQKQNIDSHRHALTKNLEATETSLMKATEQRAALDYEIKRLALLEQKKNEAEQKVKEAQLSSHEDKYHREKANVVVMLKRLFPGVYGRLGDLCRPTHKNYALAVAKIISRHMDHIVVDNMKTVKGCIGYLKQNKIALETFLPLDILEVSPLKERFRNIRHARLVYDVVECRQPDIKNAVLYVTNNALVCEQDEEALEVFSNLSDGDRTDVVSWVGTLFLRSGAISGGTGNLARKAARFDQSAYDEIMAESRQVHSDYHEAVRQLKMARNPEEIDATIRGCRTRRNIIDGDLKNVDQRAVIVEGQMASDKRDLSNISNEIKQVEESLGRITVQFAELEKSVEDSDDAMFAEFCHANNVDNIRTFEESQLRAYENVVEKEANARRLIDRIQKQIQFETARDTDENVSRRQRIVDEAGRDLETARVAEQQLAAEMDKLNKQLEQVKALHGHAKRDLHEVDEDVARARASVTGAVKEAADGLKRMSDLEARVKALRIQRHHVLVRCKLDDVKLPMSEGDITCVAEDDVEAESSQGSCPSTVPGSQLIYQREDEIVVDYEGLDERYMNLDDEDKVAYVKSKLQRKVERLEEKKQSIKEPNLKAAHKLELVQERSRAIEAEMKEALSELRKAKKDFEDVKRQRLELFNDCFKHVAGIIDSVYKNLTQRESACAQLTASDEEEPFNGSINYCCIIPGKPCRPMSSLSGGEKTLASLALLFSFRSCMPSPFIVLDEVDAALDNCNIMKLAAFLRSPQAGWQTIVISLKKKLFGQADTVFGIYPESTTDILESGMVVLDLAEYPWTRPAHADEESAVEITEDLSGK